MSRAALNSTHLRAGGVAVTAPWGVWILGAAITLAGCGKTDVYFGSPIGGSGDADADSDADGDTESDSDVDPETIVCDQGIYLGHRFVNSVAELASLAGYTGIAGQLEIQACPGCTDLDPLVCLEWAGGGLTIRTNGSLADLTGLGSLGMVGMNLVVENNDSLVTLDGLGALTHVGRLVKIAGNDALVGLDGLAGLSTVVSSLKIEDNPSLTDLDGLEGIASLSETLSIIGNTTLTDLDGLSGLTNIGEGSPFGDGLEVLENPALPDCEVCDLLEQLASGNVEINVYNNLDDTCTPVPDSCP